MILTNIVLAGLITAASICTPGSSICVYSAVKDANTVCFTVHSTFTGWTGFGMGTSMMDKSDMYISWPSNATSVYLANLKGSGHNVGLNSVQNAYLVPLDTSFKAVNNPVMKYSFCRSKTVSSGASLTETSNYIYAGSTSKPPGVSATTLQLAEHDDGTYGTFSFNFLQVNSTGTPPVTAATGSRGILSTSASFGMQDVINIHAACMWLAWTLSPIVGIFIARYAKTKLGHNWYILHMSIMGITTVGVGLIGLLFVLLYLPPPHFDSPHAILGLTVMVMMLGQVALGFISNHLYSPDREKVPLVDKSHWWLGRSLVLMGIINCQLGFMLYAESWVLSKYFVIAHWSVVGLAVLLFVWFEIKVGQINHIKASESTEFFGRDDRPLHPKGYN